MKQLYFLFFLVFGLNANAQSPSIEWQKCFGGTGHDNGNSIKKTSDGGFIIAGSTTSVNGDVTLNKGGTDVWIIKINSIGTIEWQKTFGGSGNDRAESIVQTSDGDYVFAGSTNSNNGDVSGNQGSADFWVVKIDSEGILLWQKTFGSWELERAYDIQQTTDGGFIVTGSEGSFASGGGLDDYLVVKLNGIGEMQWYVSFGGFGYDYGKSIIQTSDGGYIVAGYAMSGGIIVGNHGDYDFWIVKLSNTGVVQWQRSFGGSQGDVANNIIQTNDNGYIVAGYTNSIDGDITSAYGSGDVWVVKIDSTGNLTWQKNYGGIGSDYCSQISQTIDGGYLLFGYTNSTNGDVTSTNGSYDYWLVKIDSIGTLQWQKTIGGSLNDTGYSFEIINDENYIVVGSTQSNNGDVFGNHGGNDIFVVKLSSEDLILFDNNTVSGFELYPNPAKDILNFEVKNEIGVKSVSVYNTLGQIVIAITNVDNLKSIDVSSLTAGSYFVKVYTDKGSSSSKFIKQ